MNCDENPCSASRFVPCRRTDGRTDGRTDVTQLIVAVRNFANAPKISMCLISNFRRVLDVVCFLLGNSPASEFYMPTSVPSS
jgi:hypothetical protein